LCEVLYDLTPGMLDGKESTIKANDVIKEKLSMFEKIVADTKGTYCYGEAISMADVFLVPFVENAIKLNIDVEGLCP
jgi:maleylpyruvate isomerase